jgi:hypothetical protein
MSSSRYAIAVGLTFAFACATTPIDPIEPPPFDAGMESSTPPPKDSGVIRDAAADATTPPRPDAAPDASPLSPTSQQIQAVRTAASTTPDGGTVNLAVDNAVVTYVRPVVGTDPAGFFVQAEKTGPAVFVAVDPSTLTPAPVPGDEVSFRATSVSSIASLRMVTAVAAFTRPAQGRDLSMLLQDLSAAADVASGIDKYESEYVKIAGTLASPLAGAGADAVAGQITTAGVTTATANLRARFPTALADTLDLSPGCAFTLTGPMWRFTTSAQPSAFAAADVASLVCKAPRVVSAISTTSTVVKVVFDRSLSAASLLADGSQFAVSGGLAVSSAALTAPKEVTLTTTMQVPTSPYTVTVATTLTDLAGKGIDAAASNANFTGYDEPATLQIEELNPAISGSADLVELRALTNGNLAGIKIEENLVNNKQTLATLPTVRVAAGDLIVVHLNPAGVTDETTTQTDCVAAICHPGAWDLKGVNDFTNNARVVIVRGKDLTITDGVPMFSGLLTPSATWYLEVNALSTAMRWTDCGGAGCADNAAARLIGVNFQGVATTKAGSSLRRVLAADSNTNADWAVGPSSWGVANP